jgi:putative endonuclease
MQTKRFFVYIMTNGPKSGVLYTGITGDLVRRVWQHKNNSTPGFTSQYNLGNLCTTNSSFIRMRLSDAKKEIKGWRRSKKIELINSTNPKWDDLARDWQNLCKPQRTA